MNCFLPKGMTKTTQCTFGQERKNAEVYNTERAEIVHGKESNVTNTTTYKKFKVTSITLDHSEDYENFCKLFDISPNTLVKTFANSETKIDKLWNFIFENIDGPCFCINIFDMNKKITLSSKRRLTADEKQIYDLNFGQHYFIIVPVQKFLPPHNKEIEKLLQNENAKYPDFLENAGKILVNFEEELKTSKVCKYLATLLKVSAKKEQSHCLSMTILKSSAEKLDFEKELLIILALKKLLYIIESKFPSEAEYKNDEIHDAVMTNEILTLSQQLLNQLNDLKATMQNENPPRTLKLIYFELKLFEKHFLKSILQHSSNSIVCENLHNVLREVCDDLETTLFTKEEEYWILKEHDRNYDSLNIITFGKYCIIFTEITKKYMKQLYSENDGYLWILTSRKKKKDFQEPMLHTLDNKIYPIGLINNDSREAEATPHKLYISTCNCEAAKNEANLNQDEISEKVWLCSKCKTFLFETQENVYWLKCNCGIHDLKELDKICVQCNYKSGTKSSSINARKKSLSKFTEKRNDLENKNMQTAVNDYDSNMITKTQGSTSSFNKNEIQANDRIKPLLLPKPHNTNSSSSDQPQSANTVTPKSPDLKNIIFVGQTGAGKSTLINSIANYIEFNFEEACKKQMKCYLPCQFQLQTPDFTNVLIKDGPINENENYSKVGQSVTQKPKTYYIETSQYTFNIIDTPGLGDSRGAEQDVLNVEHIRNAVHECEKIDAICFVIPSNISKLTTNFEMIMRDLLSIFPKTACKNVFFFFTYANSTFFSIGETRNPIDEFIASFKASNNAEIPFCPENVFCVDSEAFLYFIATKQCHKYEHRTEESFGVSWRKSKEAICKFLKALNNLTPIKSSDIQEVYDLEQIIIDLKNEKNLSPELLQLYNYVAEAAAQNSMSQFSSCFKNSNFNQISKTKLKEALMFFQKAIKTPSLNEKITKFLEDYCNESHFFDKNRAITNKSEDQPLLNNFNGIEEELKEIAAILTNLWERHLLDKSYKNALLDVCSSYFAEEKQSEKLHSALKLFFQYTLENNNKELQVKIKNVLSKI